MGLFDNDELDALHDLGRRPGVTDSLDNSEQEALEDVYWDNPDELNETERGAINNAVNRYKKDTGPGISNDFDNELPGLVHETRSEVSQGADEARDAPIADSWGDWVESPGELDWPGVDTP
jgi:hypothetical protein